MLPNSDYVGVWSSGLNCSGDDVDDTGFCFNSLGGIGS